MKILMDAYLEYISNLAINKTNQVFLNSNDEKARGVFIELFNNTTKIVRIFAGSLCNSEVSNDPDYIAALSNFIERGGSLHILLNEYEEKKCELQSSKLFKRLAYYQAKERPVIVKHTEKKPMLSRGDGDNQIRTEIHFCVGDECAYRIETDIKNRTAECNYNDPDMCGILIPYFDKVFSESTEVNLDDVL